MQLVLLGRAGEASHSPELTLPSKEGEAMNQSKPKILILFYSMYGHIFSMTNAVAEGVREEGGEVTLKQVAELVPEQYWDENVKKVKESMKDIPVADPQKDLNLDFPYQTGDMGRH